MFEQTVAAAFEAGETTHSSEAAVEKRRVLDEAGGASCGPVSVLLPAYNEQAAVALQVEATARILSALGITHEIIVIDDGSTDNTALEASNAGARVLRQTENRGYGAAIKTGVIAAKYETIVISDADGTYPPEAIPAMLAQLETADMVVAARVGRRVHMPLLRRPAKWFLGRLARHIAGQPILDLNSGLRAFRRECITQYFPILSNRFSFTTTSTLALLADDYRVVYQPIDYHQRIGKSKISPRHFMDFTMLVLRMSMMFQPLRIFVPWALACGVLGLLKTAYDIGSLFLRHGSLGWHLLYQPALSTSATLLLIMGLQLLLIGMVADGLLRRLAQCTRPLTPSHGVRASESSPNGAIGREELVSQVRR